MNLRFPLALRCSRSQSGMYRHGDSNPGAIPARNWARGIPLHRRDGAIRGFAMVDVEDFERFGSERWWIRDDQRPYVVRHVWEDGRQRRLYLHREILGLAPEDSRRGDHINRDTLDNRRSNLRAVTDAQNAQNQGSRKGSLSRYRGVTWRNDRQCWRAVHVLDGKLHYIGSFRDEDEAGAAAAEWRAQNMPFSSEAAA